MTGVASPFDVTIVCCGATPAAAERDELLTSLTAAEHERRSRFHRSADADRFLVGRGTLRREVGRALGVRPRDVVLEEGPHGKPLVVGGTPHVNVSHAGELVLIAITGGCELGVDVERHDERTAHEPLEAFFSACEVDSLRSLPEELRIPAVFHAWTSRESIMKAVGMGLALPRDSFDVSVDPRLPPGLVQAHAPALVGRVFTMVTIAVPPGYTAMLALAAEAHAFRIVIDSIG